MRCGGCLITLDTGFGLTARRVLGHMRPSDRPFAASSTAPPRSLRYRPRRLQLLKTEAQKKKEARLRESRALHQTKKKLGLGPAKAPRGVVPSPLIARTWERRANLPPTSDRIPGSAPAKDLLHAYKWKRGAEESEVTKREILRKAMQIKPAYNKGALQYLPRSIDDPLPKRTGGSS
jgi:hypothetical protein